MTDGNVNEAAGVRTAQAQPGSGAASGSALLSLQEVEFLMWCIGITEGHVEKTGGGSRKEFIEKMKDSTIDKLWKLKAPNAAGELQPPPNNQK